MGVMAPDKKNPPLMTREDAMNAAECEHGQRLMRQSVNGMKTWRGEFCPFNECSPLWWQFVADMWVPPMYEPNDYLYVGWDDKAKEPHDKPE